MLDERASKACRDAGEVWEAVSSRVVIAQLRVLSRGQKEARRW